MVIPNLPKELLWTDKKDFSDFLSDELSSEVVSNIFLAKSRMTKQLGATAMLRLFNEAFYLCTRIIYEQNAESMPETYIKMIKDDLVEDEWVEHVILILFVILMQQREKSEEVLQFADKLQKQYLPDIPFRIMNIVNKMFKPWKKKMGYRLKPCPHPADILKNVPLDWCQITQNFSKHIIISVLELWDNDSEKGKVIKLIEQAYTSCLPSLKDEELTDVADKEFFIQLDNIYKATDDVVEVNAGTNKPHSSCFRHSSKFVKETVKKLVQESYTGKNVDLVLIEIVLFDHGLLTKRGEHRMFVKILKDWGILPKDLKDSVSNGMSQKFRILPEDPYKDWGDEHLKDREKCISIGNKMPPSVPYGR